ncbi:hypothetical protein NLJ89_g3660 [Agrocybe chaxingu]|uniref:Uncharacterized protein n=1 Tax=Agrocybe chaxingu TaxID=84603 RepID=A0A9W8KAR3_9AGAR|nr:hypothetical protein NLJ89_g3660 [Agrocybe chaxingu]
MSLADTATNSAHEPHQRRLRSRPARSPSLTRSPPSTRSSSVSTTLSKRSPSPIITFHPTPLSAENPKGVKNITRKVIKRLEGLGHLEMVDSEEEELMGSGEEREVEKALYAAGREAMKAAQKKLTIPATTNGYAKANGHANGHVATPKKQKADLEIPRKVLHSSIGFLTLYLYVCEGDVRTVVFVLWMALAVIVPADLLRFKSQRFERTYERFLGFLMRESEKVCAVS